MKKITLLMITGLLISSIDLRAQVDEQQMDKDLRVASTVLESLTQRDEGRFVLFNGNVEANYVKDYGVIFTLKDSPSIVVSGRRRSPSTYRYRSGGTVIVTPDAESEDDKPEAKEIEEVDLSELMIEFLVDYSQMINQLEPNDKIMISTKKSGSSLITMAGVDKVNQDQAAISVEMAKKDHSDYLAGKLSREKLIEKIKVTKNSNEGSRSKDLDLFASMLSTVFDAEYTDSYFLSWRPEYQRLSGLGAIYSFNVYSSYDEDGWYRMPGVGKKGLDDEQRKVEVEKLYPVFVQSMKETIVQYGRTIASLEPEEMLLLKVTMTKCDGCSLPKKIQFSIKQADLTAFRSGKISEKEAMARVAVTNL